MFLVFVVNVTYLSYSEELPSLKPQKVPSELVGCSLKMMVGKSPAH